MRKVLKTYLPSVPLDNADKEYWHTEFTKFSTAFRSLPDMSAKIGPLDAQFAGSKGPGRLNSVKAGQASRDLTKDAVLAIIAYFAKNPTVATPYQAKPTVHA